jgi:hypothetical protein
MLTLVVAISAVLRGWVLSILWRWFAVPMFGLPGIGIAEAVGVALIVAMLTHEHRREPKSESTSDSLTDAAAVFLRPLFALLVGWVAKGFV